LKDLVPPTPLQYAFKWHACNLYFGFGFYFCFLICIYALCCFFWACLWGLFLPSPTDPSRKLSVPSFHQHPFGCLAHACSCGTFGCLWVFLMKPFLATFLERPKSFITHCLLFLFVCTFCTVIFVLGILLGSLLLI
jgi:hypothetical protein